MGGREMRTQMLVLGVGRRHWLVGMSALLMAVTGVSASPAPQARDWDKRFEEEFFEDRSRGWHWYERQPVEEETTPVMEPPAEAGPMPKESEQDSGPPPMSSEWIRQMLPQLRDAAIDYPTPNNVKAYFYAQRVMMDKAQVFSDVARTVVRSDPLLDENLRVPFASAAKAATLRAAEQSKREILDELSTKAGLWVFYDETCAFCERQLHPINEFARKHNLEISIIHKQSRELPGLEGTIEVLPDRGQFETLGINFTPTVVLVVPPEGFYIISQGYIAYSSLVDRLVAAANQYGLISFEQYYAAVPTARGVLDASGLDDENAVDWNRTDSWVPFIENEIARTYGLRSESE